MSEIEKDYFFAQYKGFRSSLDSYWANYGGWKACIRSPYITISIFIGSLIFPGLPDHGDKCWFDIVLSVMPNILGFTLGGYAILLAFGDKEFLKLICGPDEDGSPSPFMTINGSMVHFILVQLTSIIYALLYLSYKITEGFFAYLGFTFFIYALLTSVAAVFSIFTLAKCIDGQHSADE